MCTDGITEIFLHIKRSRLRINRLKAIMTIIKFFVENYRLNKPDIIHVQSYSAMRFVKYLQRLSRIPCVITEHSTAFKRGLLSKTQLKKAGKYFDQASAVFAVSSGLKETIQPLTEKEVIVVPNLVSERFFLPPLTIKGRETFCFITIASLDHKKGIDILIKGFSKTFRDNPNVVLKICGKGPERSTFEELSVVSGVSSRIQFLGEVSREECVNLLGESHIFVLPSRVETFGIVFGEAMAMGLPIIMAKTDAYKDLVTEETGLSVNIDDVDDLSNKMQNIYVNYDKYDSEAIRAYCRKYYSETSVAQTITERYHDVMNQEEGKGD